MIMTHASIMPNLMANGADNTEVFDCCSMILKVLESVLFLHNLLECMSHLMVSTSKVH